MEPAPHRSPGRRGTPMRRRGARPGPLAHPACERYDGAMSGLEARVAELLGAGDPGAAATAVIRALGPRIAGYLRSILRNDADASDAFSAWTEHVWRGVGSFRGESSVRTWSFKIAWNAAQSLRDEAWRRLGRGFATGEASRLAAEIWTRTVERLERQRDRLALLRESLTAEEQTLLTLRIDQALSWDEIAEVISAGGTPVDAVTLRKRFERVKDRLARLARAQGLVD
jgi:RNA polymerase sigma-70 factor (ECF subfamily)